MPAPDFHFERAWLAQNTGAIAGVDEAGRGPLAGPVAAAAVMLNPDDIPAGLNDSKKLSAKTREWLFDEIMAKAACVGIALLPAAVVDTLNIRAASLLAMRRAIEALAIRPAFALIDGRDQPLGLPCPCRALIGGDGLSLSIAAASIIAKVTRDRLMQHLDRHAPAYGFARHMGYGTLLHRTAITRHGPSQWHRTSFAPMREKPVSAS